METTKVWLALLVMIIALWGLSASDATSLEESLYEEAESHFEYMQTARR